MQAVGQYNKKSVVVKLDWDCIRVARKSKPDVIFEIPYTEIVEVKRFKGLQKGIKVKTSTNKYKLIFFGKTSTKKMLKEIKESLDKGNRNIFREKESDFGKKEKINFLNQINAQDEFYKYVGAFIKKSKYDYSLGDIDKFRELMALKGNNFNENQIRWLIENELERQDYEEFKIKIVNSQFSDFDAYAMNFIDAYGDNYKQYLNFLVKLLDEKGFSISSLEIENKLEEIKKESELLDLEKSILDFDENSPNTPDETKFNPEESKIWFNKGCIYYDIKDANEAIRCYDNALELNSNNLEALNMKGLILHNLGNINAAAACYNKALHIDSNNAEAWNNMGILLFDSGQTQKAAVCYNMASRVDSSAKTFSSLGKSLKLLGKAPKAISKYQSFMEQSASDPSALMGSDPSMFADVDPSAIGDTDPSAVIDSLSQLFGE